MDAGHDHMSRIGTAADDGDLVLVPQRRHAGIAAPAVGMDGRSGHGDSLNEGDQTVRRYVRDTAQADAANATTTFLWVDSSLKGNTISPHWKGWCDGRRLHTTTAVERVKIEFGLRDGLSL